MTNPRTALLLLPALMAGCGFNEHLPEVDINGTVVIPREAATRIIVDPVTGEEEEVVDARFIGPIYLGAYPNIEDGLFDYPHPEMGPVITEGVPGDAYPYGGGTVGRFDFACFSSTTCQVVTGRYSDYDDLMTFFDEYLNQPITDESGSPVQSADYYRSYCYSLFEYTADFELDFISGEDGLHFSENEDGDFVAEFDMWQVTYYPNMKIWGWMDAPSDQFTFSTCDKNNGATNNEYTNDLIFGTSYSALLNFPSNYIFAGDYVVAEPWEATFEDADAFREAEPSPTIRFDFAVE